MRIIAVDDKPVPRRALVSAIKAAAPDAEVVGLAGADEVLSLADLGSYEVAFIDVDMPKTNGIQLALLLKASYPRMNIVFATGYAEYMADAFAMHSSGYLMKPITADAVRNELENLRYAAPQPSDDKLFVRCFGDFEVFAAGEPVAFGRTKTKELFAYLVDRRGAMCSMGDIEAILWEGGVAGSSQRSYVRTLISDLRSTLHDVGFDDVVVKRRDALGVLPASFVCDYYDFLAGDPLAIASWHGEYMRQYSWAEVTLAGILD